ncbi:MAG: family 43 glycosylhydrolase [Prevotella sp.]|nr:family 43 glycosylhydrolase [Prevotella sp.]
MKQKILLIALALVSVLTAAKAQGLKPTYKTSANGNPISPCIFCADPTAVEYEGRLYVYGTNDHQQFIANERSGENHYGAIKQLVVFSTDDLVNWTFHGVIDVGALCGSWCYASWAPSVVSRQEDDGQTHFYLYFSNSGAGVGVLTSTSPTGPWRSPLSRALISKSTPGVGQCSAPFDPGVCIDADGTGWLAFGGGSVNAEGTKLMPGNARIARLKPDLVSLDGAAVEIPAPYHFEANELNVMNGKLVYTYCTTWSDRDDWDSYGRTVDAPTSASMCYMTTSTPLNPSSWLYRGEYLANPGRFGYPYGNNHTHLQKFGISYYLLYHTQALEQKMQTGASGFRSIAISRASVYERSQTVNAVTPDDRGPDQLTNLNPYALQQAETMATAGGISYEDFSNVDNPSKNLSHQPLLVSMQQGSWIMVRGVDFGADAPAALQLSTRGSGTLEIRLDNLGAQPAAVVTIDADGTSDYALSDATRLKGIHNVYFVATASDGLQWDSWQFLPATSDGITRISALHSQPSPCFDLLGRPTASSEACRSQVILTKSKKLIQ